MNFSFGLQEALRDYDNINRVVFSLSIVSLNTSIKLQIGKHSCQKNIDLLSGRR